MEPKLIQTEKGQYVPGVFDTDKGNQSGWIPEGDRVLVLCDQAVEKTTGGIIITPETVEKMTMAAETGILVALGATAFEWTTDKTRRRDPSCPKPQPGSFVYMERYAGQLLLGDDGQKYRLMEDKCIGAIRAALPVDQHQADAVAMDVVA